MHTCALLVTAVAICIGSFGCQKQREAESVAPRELRGPYPGVPTPGSTPELFAPGLVSRGYHELGLTISVTGDECFYVTANNKYPQYVIIHLTSDRGLWSLPEVASFSGYYSDYRPYFTPEGSRLFFSSVRPLPGDTVENSSHDIWVTEKMGEIWSDPIHLGEPINTANPEINPAISSSGTVYYQSMSDDGRGFDIYYCQFENGAYLTPRRLPGEINTEHDEGGPYIAPDESYLLFHSNRPGGLGRSDLYISFRKDDSTWTECRNLGPPINSPESETIPFLSPDEKYLFFTSFVSWDPDIYKGKTYQELISLYQSPRNGSGTLYWVRADFLENFREEAFR